MLRFMRLLALLLVVGMVVSSCDSFAQLVFNNKYAQNGGSVGPDNTSVPKPKP